MKVAKYRPVLTVGQIAALVELLQTPEVSERMQERLELRGAYAVLLPFLAKINCNAVAPSWNVAATSAAASNYRGLSPSEKREAAFQKLQRVGIAAMEVEELELADSYRMEHGLMTAEELEEVEARMLDSMGL